VGEEEDRITEGTHKSQLRDWLKLYDKWKLEQKNRLTGLKRR
jgi:hypothetical protein